MKKSKFSRSIKRYNRFLILFTWKCNLNCSYCYLKYDRILGENEVISNNLDKVIKLIEVVKDYSTGKWEIILSGGEPLLVSKIVKNFLRKLITKNVPHIAKITLLTNGTLWDGELIKLLKASRKEIEIVLSLHARNNPIFWKNVEKYIKEVSHKNISFVYVLSRKELYNLEVELENILKTIKKIIDKYYPNSISYFDFYHNYFALQLDISLLSNISKEYIKLLIEKYKKFLESFEDVFGERFPRWFIKYPKLKGVEYCPAFNNLLRYITIYPNMHISACGFMPYSFIRQTQYFKDITVDDIIKNPELLKQTTFTKKGEFLTKIYTKLSYKWLKKNGYVSEGFFYCPLKSLLHKNRLKIDIYPKEIVEVENLFQDPRTFFEQI